MITKIVLIFGLIGCVVSGRRSPYSYNEPESFEYSSESREAKYDFNYAVKDDYSGNNFGHQESRDGDRTQGSYYVQLPDGRLQKVTYYVDGDSGYQAEVTYEGEARYDSVESREYGRTAYSPPRPVYSSPKPVYTPPRPVYTAPESEESLEIPVYQSLYGPPRRTYG